MCAFSFSSPHHLVYNFSVVLSPPIGINCLCYQGRLFFLHSLFPPCSILIIVLIQFLMIGPSQMVHRLYMVWNPSKPKLSFFSEMQAVSWLVSWFLYQCSVLLYVDITPQFSKSWFCKWECDLSLSAFHFLCWKYVSISVYPWKWKIVLDVSDCIYVLINPA